MPNVRMPPMPPKVRKIKLAKWLKAEGDEVQPGDVLAVIETNKAAIDVESEVAGTLLKILVAEGTEDLAMDTPLAVISDAVEVPESASEVVSLQQEEALGGCMARTTETGEGVRVFATPLAKRIAQQRGIDLLSVKGTGPYGRIVVSDLDGELAPGDHPERKAMDAAVEKSHKGSQQTTKVLPGVAVSAEQVSGNAGQKPEARRSERSVDPVPQFSLTTDVTLDNLLELQGRLNVLAPNDVGGANHWQVSFDGLVMKAVALAMLKHPGTNVSWTGETVAMHQHADVGLVAQTPGGVRVSVVRRVEGKGVAQISSEACEYAHQATVRAPTSEAFEGGAVALFNIAKSGIRQFNAVVEPPFSSVLALGAVECRPIVKCGEIVKARQMTVTLSSDIRCIDVGLGGDFLLSIKNYLEEPGLMLV